MKNLDPDSLNLLAKIASAKFGKSVNDIKADVEENNASKLLDNLSDKDAEKVKSIMNNPEMMQKIMSSEKAQKLFKTFMNKE